MLFSLNETQRSLKKIQLPNCGICLRAWRLSSKHAISYNVRATIRNFTSNFKQFPQFWNISPSLPLSSNNISMRLSYKWISLNLPSKIKFIKRQSSKTNKANRSSLSPSRVDLKKIRDKMLPPQTTTKMTCRMKRSNGRSPKKFFLQAQFTFHPHIFSRVILWVNFQKVLSWSMRSLY